MVKYSLVFISALLIFSCSKQSEQKHTVFGDEVDIASVVDLNSLETKVMSVDSVADVVVAGKVSDVCKAKGCWMTITKPDGDQMRVTFKDYALFMPKDIVGKEVVIHGVASKKEVSVADLQHYAKDAGKSEEEIASIENPENTLAFEADGVLIR
ncbi:DUF4920 domain-containing protein [Chondrinema litorale]|uniref:DUF4920 domain-containing protein n=1 Tax=Chondrinema litorale TaxID=2994555 RepID=UPI002543B148|nr:DUF4920 domain-containing protein [Chondrinema litorale]UZR93638.1 DUF4920 domain-containing protein [Chondrinema litorale]